MIDSVPWRVVKRGFVLGRQYWFSVEKPEYNSKLRVYDASLPEVRRAFGNNHYTNAWEMSWHYEGEDGNMRQPVHLTEDEELSHGMERGYGWYQNHVRLFIQSDHIEVVSHLELEPTEYPDLHLDNFNLRVEPATQSTKELLESEGFKVREVDS